MGNENQYVNECLETNWISSQGKFITKFEEKLAEYHNSKYCVVTSSCTTAIHLALMSLDIKEGDEVICPALTFIAPANMIQLSGAKLVLVDINPNTLTIDINKIEEKISRRTKAIIIVHQFGHAAHMDEILKISKKYNLKVIEDNAEALGGKYKNQILGSIGDVGTLSFFANKIITSGEGGALLTNNSQIFERARILRDHGMSREIRYKYVLRGYNYRMTNLQAAIGLAQLEKLDEILSIRESQMNLYYKLLNNENIYLRNFADWVTPVHWLMTIALTTKKDRNDFIACMKDQGIECRQMINPVYKADQFKNLFREEDYKVTESLSGNFVHLPSSTNLKNIEIEKICSAVLNYVN